VSDLDTRTWTAQADAWEVEGRLREPHGGGAGTIGGVRLMSSGLPHAMWNGGDVVDPDRIELEAIRAWFASRAGGAGVPWGLRVPARWTLPIGRRVVHKRCMALEREGFRPAAPPAGVTIALAGPEQLETVARVDATAFGDPLERNRAWVAPHFGASQVEVALATRAGEPVGVATAVRSDGLAGPAAGLFGIAVLEPHRGIGIGPALTSWLVARAFEAGVTLVHLNPVSDPVARVYGRLGFVETAGIDIYEES
jgi:GNAT superfamily N-acetyltransferase